MNTFENSDQMGTPQEPQGQPQVPEETVQQPNESVQASAWAAPADAQAPQEPAQAVQGDAGEQARQQADQAQQAQQAAQAAQRAAWEQAQQARQAQGDPRNAYRQPQPYHNAGAGQKESPYANSPYEMPRQAYGYAPPKPPKQPRQKKVRKGGAGRAVLAAVMALVLVAGSCGITAFVSNSYWSNRLEQMNTSFNERLNALQNQISSNPGTGNSVSGSPVATQEGGLTPSQVYAQNVQSVVAISNQATTNIYGQVSETASSGSGFILTEDGYIVTNYHVVEGANRLTVITYDGTEYTAALVGGDENNDIAVLKIDASGLPAVTLGSSNDLIVGDQVVAIGNPLGELTSTQTVGYVSAKDRDVTTEGTIINMLQTDAAINPGNSGGPLFNMKGEVVGITTAKYSGTTASGASIEGIGFAIPIDDVKNMISDLMNYGYVTGAYLGVMVSDVNSAATAYGVPQGAHVREVTPGYCAQDAGVQEGDIITALGGYEVTSITSLTRALRHFKSGETVRMTVYRSGQYLDLNVTLSEKPQDTAEPTETQPSGQEDGGSSGIFPPFFGGQG